ncbi:hypothetical protein CCAX7_29120 [Capsulimonas corticalis]|uniref:DUF4253 domain-containing protein n=1 Tax=Capsulimonas corticalis TaxID=2219043 RepID=A0A402CT36_9BACT|nr:DUF4253 domain-containing protein [Capsulimonas corticalis]BDI30861.1 hypothetical protein CCAX7_29120 [Capsulimonas corticalis]
MELTPEEMRMIETIGFPHDVAIFVKQATSGALEHAAAEEDGQSAQAPAGLSVSLSKTRIEQFIETHQAALLLKGCRAFWSERRLPSGLRDSDELILLPTTDMMAIVRLRRSNGVNHGVSTADVIDRIAYWSTQCRLNVVGAACDWVALRFDTLPENLCVFAEDAYRFCPDAVEQGVAITYQEDSRALAAARALCPGARLKFTTQSGQSARALAGDFHAQFQATIREASYPPEVKAMLLREASEAARTPGLSREDGTKLLAYEIQRTKTLFLWWD